MPSKPPARNESFELSDETAIFDWGEKLHQFYHQGKRLLASYWWILILTTVLGMAWQGYKEIDSEPIYVSSAEMIVSGRFALPESVYREELSNFFGTQMELMRSASVQRLAHERVAMLYPDMKRAWVRLAVAQSPQASIFRLRAEGGSPEYTQAFLNAVMEEYQNFRRKMRTQTSESTLLAITEQLYRLEEEIDQQEAAEEAFKKQNNLVFLKEQAASTGSYLAQLKNNQAELQTQLLLLETVSEGKSVESVEIAQLGGFTSLARPENLEAYNEARLRAARLKAERDEYGVYLKETHPKLIDFNLEIERTQNLIDILQRQTFDALSERKILLQRQITNLDVVIDQWERTALEISRKTAEFERLNFRLARSRETYQQLSRSIQSINLNQQLEQETVEVKEPASRAVATTANVTGKVVEGALTGLLAGIGLIVGIAFLDTRIKHSEDLLKRFDYALLGVIPEEALNKNADIDVLKLRDERHRFAEACRSLRSSLLLNDLFTDKQPKSFIVTSAIPQDGKSTISVNLAIAFSFTSQSILLVDADMRRGRLHKLFPQAKRDLGLSEVLRGRADFADVVTKTDYENLDFISTGNAAEQPGELLLSSRMDELLAWAKKKYAYIIFDSPPVLAVDDTVGFSDKVDGIIFTVRANHTASKQIKASLDRLAPRASRILGFVLNCADVRGTDYYYYKKYDHYYAPKQ